MSAQYPFCDKHFARCLQESEHNWQAPYGTSSKNDIIVHTCFDQVPVMAIKGHSYMQSRGEAARL